jgi:hypothetical protein
MNENIEHHSDSKPHWGIWGTIIFGFLLGSIYFVLPGFLIGLYVGFTGRGALSHAEALRLMQELQFNGFIFSVTITFSALVCGALLMTIIKLKRDASIKEYLGLVGFNSDQVLRWGGLLVALMLITDISYILLGLPILPEFNLATYKSAKYPLILWFAMVIVAPLWEECFFRGFLLKGLSSSFLRPVGAVVIISLLWAGSHGQYGLREIIPIFIFGCLLGAARLKTGSVIIAIAMHSFSNIVSLVETIIYLKWT